MFYTSVMVSEEGLSLVYVVYQGFTETLQI